MIKEIKWSQWSPHGMMRCGYRDYNTLIKWLVEIGKDAKKYIKCVDKDHLVYGRKIYDADDNLEEIRFYCDTYVTDAELDEIVMQNPRDVLYVVHKDGSLG